MWPGESDVTIRPRDEPDGSIINGDATMTMVRSNRDAKCRQRLAGGLVLLLGLLLIRPVAADEPVLPEGVPVITAMLPAGLPRGATTEVVVTGRSLAPWSALRVGGKGVTAEFVELPKGTKPNSRRVAVRLHAAADAPLGMHELRIVTPHGTSNAVRFIVGAYPEMTESEPNNHAGIAEPVPSLPIVINGVLDRGEDRDWFRFSAKAGQQIVLDLCGERLHPYIDRLRPGWLEGLITVRDVTDVAPASDAFRAAATAVKQAESAVRRTQARLKSARTAVQTARQAVAKAGKNQDAKKRAAARLADATKRLANIQTAANEAVQQRNKARQALAAARDRLDRAMARPWRRLAYAQDLGGRQDPLLVVTIPRDGIYAVEIRDELFRGRAEFNYRLTLGAVPRILAAYPAIARRGRPTPVDLHGVNLVETEQAAVLIPADWPLHRPFTQFIQTKRGYTNGIVVLPSDDRQVKETEPNDRAEEGNQIATPSVVNGIIAGEGDFDNFRFHAAKGQRIVFRVEASRFASPLDARLDLYDARGRRLKTNDDTSGTPDALIDYTFSAEGDYVIRVGDTTGQGSPRHVYALQIHEARPDFVLTVTPDNPRVAAGASVGLKVLVERREGFNGPVELVVENAPKGARVTPTVIGKSQSEALVVVTMPSGAPAGVTPLRVVGRAKIGDGVVEHEAIPAQQLRYINSWRYVPVDDLILSVIPAAPLTVSWSQPELAIESGKRAKIKVKVERAKGVEAPIRVVLTGLPPRVATPPVTIDAKSKEGEIEIRSYRGAPVNTANVLALATIRFNGRTFVQGSMPLRLNVLPPKPKKKPKQKAAGKK